MKNIEYLFHIKLSFNGFVLIDFFYLVTYLVCFYKIGFDKGNEIYYNLRFLTNNYLCHS